MADKIYLHIGENGGTAVSESKPEESIHIPGPSGAPEIWKLIEQQKELGIKLSRLLKKEGLTAADDDEKTIIEPPPK
jgi:hypothetical protein